MAGRAFVERLKSSSVIQLQLRRAAVPSWMRPFSKHPGRGSADCNLYTVLQRCGRDRVEHKKRASTVASSQLCAIPVNVVNAGNQ